MGILGIVIPSPRVRIIRREERLTQWSGHLAVSHCSSRLLLPPPAFSRVITTCIVLRWRTEDRAVGARYLHRFSPALRPQRQSYYIGVHNRSREPPQAAETVDFGFSLLTRFPHSSWRECLMDPLADEGHLCHSHTAHLIDPSPIPGSLGEFAHWGKLNAQRIQTSGTERDPCELDASNVMKYCGF